MYRKPKIYVLIFGAVVAFAAIGLIVESSLDNRSTVGRIRRWWNGESYFEQRANDLADDLRHAPGLARIQPWALETMARFRAGQLKGRDENHFYWANGAFLLATQEVPTFIMAQLGVTNKLGDVQPDVSIVTVNGDPEYVVLDWGVVYGIVVGPTNYEFSFSTAGTNHVAPGVYTFFVTR